MEAATDKGTRTAAEFTLSTEQFAAINMVKAESVRSRVTRKGSYFGVTPLKLGNRRTAWPNIQVRGDIVPDAS